MDLFLVLVINDVGWRVLLLWMEIVGKIYIVVLQLTLLWGVNQLQYITDVLECWSEHLIHSRPVTYLQMFRSCIKGCLRHMLLVL